MEMRKLAAIVAMDLAGFARLMGEDEAGTARAVRQHRNQLRPLVTDRGGRVVKTMGDGLLLEFPSIVDAVECAVQIQQVLLGGASGGGNGGFKYRIGVHLGDVIVDGEDILGEGVNIAARLEGLCEPGGVLISGSAHEHVRGRVRTRFTDLGEKDLKNIAFPVRVYQAVPGHGESNGDGDTRVGSARTLPLVLPEKPSIAVLPFQNLSGDPEQEYLADGLVEELITALSHFRSFFVIARNSSFTYKGRTVDVRQVGRELGVRYVIEGSVRRAGNRLRISAQLVEAATANHVWTDRIDGELSDVFDLQDRVTMSIVGAIEPNLRSAEFARTSAKPTKDLNAYDLYLQALFHLNAASRASHEKAITLLRQALRLDPAYADAMSALAFVLGEAAMHGWVEADGKAEALALAREAVLLDRQNPTVLAVSASCEALYGGSYDQSDLFAAEALRLAPDGAHVRLHCGIAFGYGGRCDEAISHYEAAIRLNPLDTLMFRAYTGLVVAHFFAGRFEESIRWAARVIADNPTAVTSRRYLCAALALAGRVGEAEAEMGELRRLAPHSSLARSALASFRHKWQLDMYLDGLSRAGLPETA
jgi:adenylate cyclase